MSTILWIEVRCFTFVIFLKLFAHALFVVSVCSYSVAEISSLCSCTREYQSLVAESMPNEYRTKKEEKKGVRTNRLHVDGKIVRYVTVINELYIHGEARPDVRLIYHHLLRDRNLAAWLVGGNRYHGDRMISLRVLSNLLPIFIVIFDRTAYTRKIAFL